jgi:hypothetical protein
LARWSVEAPAYQSLTPENHHPGHGSQIPENAHHLRSPLPEGTGLNVIWSFRFHCLLQAGTWGRVCGDLDEPH